MNTLFPDVIHCEHHNFGTLIIEQDWQALSQRITAQLSKIENLRKQRS